MDNKLGLSVEEKKKNLLALEKAKAMKRPVRFIPRGYGTEVFAKKSTAQAERNKRRYAVAETQSEGLIKIKDLAAKIIKATGKRRMNIEKEYRSKALLKYNGDNIKRIPWDKELFNEIIEEWKQKKNTLN